MKLAIENFYAGYGSVTVVNDLSLTLTEGEVVAVLGRNGMGKSTFLKGILGLLQRARGSVRFDGIDLIGHPTAQIIRRGVAFAGQEGANFGELTVEENLAAATLYSKHDPEREKALLTFFPILGQRRLQRAGTLSGGEQRMLALVRVLLSAPRLIVLDEISAGLQPAKVAEVENALRWERRERGTTILMVEQNLDLALRLSDRLTVMKLGGLILEESAKNPGLRDRLIRQLAP